MSKSERTSTKVSKTMKSGLTMPVGRVQRKLKEGRYADRIGTAGAVYMTAVLEYLTAEMLEMAGNAARDNQRQRIAPRHLMMAIKNDAEMNELLKDVVIPEAGVVPFINPVLLPKPSKKNRPQTDETDETAETAILSQEH